jgi:hypothetical protein
MRWSSAKCSLLRGLSADCNYPMDTHSMETLRQVSLKYLLHNATPTLILDAPQKGAIDDLAGPGLHQLCKVRE